MAQAREKRMDWFRYCRTKAFRAGYEDARTEATARFGQWGKYELAYEDGRQVVAFLMGSGGAVAPLPTSSAFVEGQELQIVRTVLAVQPRRRAAA